MSDADARTRHNPLDVIGHAVDRLDPVVHEENLTTAIQFTRDSLIDQPIVPWLDVGEHRRTIARRRLHESHVAEAGQ